MTEPITDQEIEVARKQLANGRVDNGEVILSAFARIDLERNRADEAVRKGIESSDVTSSMRNQIRHLESKLHAAEAECERLRGVLTRLARGNRSDMADIAFAAAAPKPKEPSEPPDDERCEVIGEMPGDGYPWIYRCVRPKGHSGLCRHGLPQEPTERMRDDR